jgi:hypothetical protein
MIHGTAVSKALSVNMSSKIHRCTVTVSQHSPHDTLPTVTVRVSGEMEFYPQYRTHSYFNGKSSQLKWKKL